MVAIVILMVVIFVAGMIIFGQQASVQKAKKMLRLEQENLLKLEKKVEEARTELRKHKDELERNKNELQQARELSRKKLKKQSQIETEPNVGSEIAMITKALDDSYKAISAMETQMDKLKEEHEKNEFATRQKLEAEFNEERSSKDEEIAELKNKLAKAVEDLKKQKRLIRPEGVKIDLTTLPDEASAEFARLYRKAENNDRLHGIARAKLLLAQEKFAELQKRYFGVCRELALLAGKNENIEPAKAREVAEDIVKNSPEKTSSEKNDEENID